MAIKFSAVNSAMLRAIQRKRVELGGIIKISSVLEKRKKKALKRLN